MRSLRFVLAVVLMSVSSLTWSSSVTMTLSQHIDELSKRAQRAEQKALNSSEISNELRLEFSKAKDEAVSLHNSLKESRISHSKTLARARVLEQKLAGLESMLKDSEKQFELQVSATLYWKSQFRTANRKSARRGTALIVVATIAAGAITAAVLQF